jgi:hypothetical protein
MNPVDAIFDRLVKSVEAGVYTIDAASSEALRDIRDLYDGKPHGFDLDRVYNEVLARVERNQR